MKTITRTIYGTLLQTAQLLKLPYQQKPNTTLNEKFNIFPDLRPDNNAVPSVRYYCIGIGGHRSMVGADGRTFISPIQHRPDDAALFDHIPFIVREPDEDLTTEQRRKYALRKQITVRGSNYIAYYLKRLDLDEVVPSMKLNTVIDGTTTTIPFVPTSANLNPIAPAIPNGGVITANGEYLSASGLVTLSFSAEEVAELVNVAKVIFDNELYAIISEIGIVAGEDKVVTVTTSNNTTLNYTEVVSATVVTHITEYHSVGFLNRGLDLTLELGSTEPLIGIADIPSSP
jgi:hypothetical protein